MFSAYDAAGRRLSARFASASGQGVIYVYDSAGRLSTETSTIGTSRALSYQYDVASNRTRVTWPDAAPAFFVDYTYDAMNRVDLVRENGATSGPGVLANYDYDARGRRDLLTRGNGASTDYSYDAASRLTGLAHDLAGTADDQSFAFAYTAASQLSQRTAANDNYNWPAANITRAYSRNGLNQYTNIATNGVSAAQAHAGGDGQRGNLTSDGSRNFESPACCPRDLAGCVVVGVSFNPAPALRALLCSNSQHYRNRPTRDRVRPAARSCRAA